jgi:hypothetical protein
MGNTYLAHGVKATLVTVPAAAGSTVPKGGGSYVDMSGFEGVRFIGTLATNTGSTKTVAMKAQGSTSSTAWEDLKGASVTSSVGHSNTFLDLDVYRPVRGEAGHQFRYVRPHITKNSTKVFGGVLALQYAPRTMSVTQSTSTIANSTGDAKCVVSPGTTT